MTKDEALRLALEALGNTWTEPNNEQYEIEKKAITAIKTALEVKDEPWEQFYPEMGKPKLVEVQDGKCKYCTDGCPACDARKLPEQEPLAWGVFEGNLHDMFFSQEEAQKMADLKGTHAEVRPLYATPPQRTWVGLTRTELIKCGVLPFGLSYELYEAIEAKLKEKNNV